MALYTYFHLRWEKGLQHQPKRQKLEVQIKEVPRTSSRTRPKKVRKMIKRNYVSLKVVLKAKSYFQYHCIKTQKGTTAWDKSRVKWDNSQNLTQKIIIVWTKSFSKKELIKIQTHLINYGVIVEKQPVNDVNGPQVMFDPTMQVGFLSRIISRS